MNRLAVVLCVMGTLSCAGPDSSARPELRPGMGFTPDAGLANSGAETETGGFFSALRPVLRGARNAVAPAPTMAGAVCGDPALKGKAIGAVPGSISGCGVEGAVRITSVSDVLLSTPSTMDCATAGALKSWVDDSAKPALAAKGGGLREIKVAAHYACRKRNNAKTGKISEHGKGRAIDISGFALANGSEISVLTGWRAGSSGKALRRMHAEACGTFGTVLGPNANRFHLDHFHFDTALHRSGSFCR